MSVFLIRVWLKNEEFLLEPGRGSFHRYSHDITALGSPSVPIWDTVGPFVPAVSFDLDASPLTRPSHVADTPLSSHALEVSLARCCDVFWIVSYPFCIFFANTAPSFFLLSFHCPLSCLDENSPYYFSAVALIFIPLSAEHRISDSRVTSWSTLLPHSAWLMDNV